MKKSLQLIFLFFIFGAVSFFSYFVGKNSYKILSISKNSVGILPVINEKPLEKYTLENLIQNDIKPAKLAFNIASNKFTMEFEPEMNGKTKKVSGSINTPTNDKEPHPVVLMIRGYVDQKIYTTGMGTKRAAAEFAKAGFITIAPDFLGYGESDPEAGNIFETRFQTYTTVLSLLKSIDQTPNWDGKNIFLWAHSNGGQIALTILAITNKNYPTVLWAPITKPFPYSILYYTDESADRGKLIRKELSKFEDNYDVEKYSFDNYLDRINTPIELHQGTADDAVPVIWSDEFVNKLKKLDHKITYYKYQAGDHNLTPGWDIVVARDIAFFKGNMQK